MKYLFKLPIGDWSADGHEKCHYYVCEANKPVEFIREVHYRIKEVTGIDIHSICSNYEENSIDRDMFKNLQELGFTEAGIMEFDNEITLDADYMAKLWVFLLQTTEPSLKIIILPEDEIPMLPFYGFDEQGRNIDQVGYGILS